MKHNLPTLALTLALVSACAPSDLSIRLLGAGRLDEECKVENNVFIGIGSLDVSYSTTYLARFNMQSTLETTVTQVGTDVVATATRNDFFTTNLLLKYTSTGALAGLPPQTTPHHFVLPAGSGDDSFITVNLIPPKTGEALLDRVAPGDEPVDLLVSLTVQGKLSSGQQLNSNEVVFPITIRNTGFTGCPAGMVPDPTQSSAPCGNFGQDGSIIVCKAP